MIGFVTTAWVTFIFLLFHYVAMPPGTGSDSVSSLVPIDHLIQNRVQKMCGKGPSSEWAEVLETVVLTMSDQQLVTGLAIIISGYYQLSRGLQYYHWRWVTILAWFSATTHMATLLCLESYFRQHKFIWYARVILMVVLAIMIAVGLIPTGVDTDDSTEAACAFDLSKVSFEALGRGFSVIVGDIMIIVGVLARALQVSRTMRKFTLLKPIGRRWREALVWSCRKLQNLPRWLQAALLPGVAFFLSLLVFLQCLLDYLRTRVFGLQWLFMSLTWGTIRMSLPKITVKALEEENIWSFGQLLPVFLLFIPMLLMAEGYSKIVNSSEGNFGPNSPPSHGNLMPSSIGARENSHQLPLHADEITQVPQDGQDLHSVTQVQAMPFSIDPRHTANPVTQASNDTLNAGILLLCEYEFRHESWYLDYMYFYGNMIMSCGLFYLASYAWRPSLLGTLNLVLPFCASVCLYPIPLYGVLDKLEPSQPLVRSFVKAIIGTDRRSRRYLYGLFFCWPWSIGIVLYTNPAIEVVIGPFSLFALLLALFLVVCSMFSVVFSRTVAE